eukprot:3056116-Rhodomonas_salina.3
MVGSWKRRVQSKQGTFRENCSQLSLRARIFTCRLWQQQDTGSKHKTRALSAGEVVPIDFFLPFLSIQEQDAVWAGHVSNQRARKSGGECDL